MGRVVMVGNSGSGKTMLADEVATLQSINDKIDRQREKEARAAELAAKRGARRGTKGTGRNAG